MYSMTLFNYQKADNYNHISDMFPRKRYHEEVFISEPLSGHRQGLLARKYCLTQ